MKELVKPNRIEAVYQEAVAYQPELEERCGIDRSCESRNRCRSGNRSDGEVMDEILF